MKRALALAAFLGLMGFSGAVYAQEMGEDEKPADEIEQPNKDEAKKEDTKKPDARPQNKRAERRDYQELGRILRAKDTDRDNKLSKEEFGDAELFTTLDKNEDGSLTLQEMLAGKDAIVAAAEKAQAAVMKEEFGILDRDDSGKLSKTELGKDFEALLEKGDADKDGSLSLEEFTAARNAADKPAAGGDRPARGDILAQLDKDGDGKISKEEAPDRLKENFDKLDADSDGFLSKEELAAVIRDRMKGQRPGAENAAPKKDEQKKEEGDKNDTNKKEDAEKDDEF